MVQQTLPLAKKPDDLHPWEFKYMQEADAAYEKDEVGEPIQNRGFYSHLQSGIFSDFTVRDRNGHDWKVHKIILANGCESFANIFERGLDGSNGGVLTFPGHHPQVLKAFLEYLYAGDYNIPETHALGELMFNIEVYMIGGLHRVLPLQGLSYRRLLRLWFSGRCPCGMIETCIKRIYESKTEDDQRIRTFLSQLAAVHLSGLLSNPTFTEVLANSSAFGADLGRALSVMDGRHECTGCKTFMKKRTKPDGAPAPAPAPLIDAFL